MSLKKGTILEDRWVIGDKLGSGAYGSVYKATHSRRKTAAVVKYCLLADINDQLKIEARVYGKLRDAKAKGFPKLYDSFLYRGRMVLVLEKLGRGVGTKIENGRCHSLSSVLNIASAVLRRIHEVHRVDYIHRDIRDDNILYGLEGSEKKIYLIDFSISQKYRDADGKHIEEGRDPYPAGNDFFSTGMYHSRQLHSRRDDMETFMYVFAYLLNGKLPWTHLRDEEAIWKEKNRFDKSEMFKEMPSAYQRMWMHIKELPFKAKPEYRWLHEQIVGMAKSDI